MDALVMSGSIGAAAHAKEALKAIVADMTLPVDVRTSAENALKQ